MTNVVMAAPEGATAPLPLANGADGAPGHEANGSTGLIVITRPHLPPIRRYSHDFVEKARGLVEGTIRTLKDIAAELHIGQRTLGNWIVKYDWQRPAGAPPLQGPRRRYGGADQRRELVGRLHRAFGRQLAQLEKRTKDGGGETLEKDARTLGVLAKTLETLIELDRDGAKVGEPEPRDRGRLRLELAERIAAWAAEETQSAEPGGSAG